jgi:hypothetical protein
MQTALGTEIHNAAVELMGRDLLLNAGDATEAEELYNKLNLLKEKS